MVHPFRFTSRQPIRPHLHIKLLRSYRTTRNITLAAKRLQLPQHLSPHQHNLKTRSPDFSNKLVNFPAKVRANTTRNYLNKPITLGKRKTSKLRAKLSYTTDLRECKGETHSSLIAPSTGIVPAVVSSEIISSPPTGCPSAALKSGLSWSVASVAFKSLSWRDCGVMRGGRVYL